MSEPREGGAFDFHRVDAADAGVGNAFDRRAALELFFEHRHEGRIETAAPGHNEALGFGRVACECFCGAPGREPRDRRCNVGGCAFGKALELRFEPVDAKEFSAGRLRCRKREIRGLETAFEKRFDRVARASERAVAVAGLAKTRLHEGVKKHVARARIEPENRCAPFGNVRRRRKNRDVGDAADIEYGCRFVARKSLCMKSGYERRAFAARGDVAASEVGNDINAAALSNERRVVELQREALLGAVTDRLTVHSDGGNRPAIDAVLAEKLFDNLGVEICERYARRAHALDFVGTAPESEREEFGPECIGHRQESVPEARHAKRTGR